MTTTSSTTGTTTTSSTTSSSISSALGDLSSSFDTFLSLLTTQLQNQDPTSPMDTDKMTEQLVQMAAVQQQIQMNSNLESLISLQQTAQMTDAAAMLGHSVNYTGTTLALQNSSATVDLPAAGTASSALITIKDAAGNSLRTASVSLSSSASSWNWDGKTDSGTQLPDGNYTISVSGLDSSGASTSLSYSLEGKVTGLGRNSSNAVQVQIGSINVDLANVTQVTD